MATLASGLSPALLIGATLGAWLPPLPPPLQWQLAAAVALVALSLRRPLAGAVLLLAFAGLRGEVASALGSLQRCGDRVLVEAEVLGVPARAAQGWRFTALVRPRGTALAYRAAVEFPAQAERPSAGERWQLLLRPVPTVVRALGTDPRQYLLRDGLQGRARVAPSPLNRRLSTGASSLQRARERVAARIHAQVEDPAAAALLAALAVGVTGEVTREQWRDFNATGITHLVAISGMHVTFFALMVMWLARRLWNHLAVLQRWRRERCAAACGLLLATAYALLSGFSVPAQRTLLMLAAFLLARECARASGPCWSLGIASLLVLLADPFAVLDAGFWLSFLAVAVIVLVPGSRLHSRGGLHDAAQLQFAVSFALLPLTLLLFGNFSVAGLAINAVAIPLFSFVLVPGALLATLGYLPTVDLAVPAADLCIRTAALLAEHLLPLLAQVAQLPGASLRGPARPLALLMAGLASVVLILPLRTKLRLSAAALLCLTFLPTAPRVPPGTAIVNVLGAEEEMAAVVDTATHRLVFGTGEVRGSRGLRFQLLATRLASEGRRVDLLIAGPLNADTLRALTLGAAQLAPHRAFGAAARSQPPEVSPCASRLWRWDDVEFELGAPPAGRGCLLWVRIASSQVLLQQVNAEGARSLQVLPRTRSGVALKADPSGWQQLDMDREGEMRLNLSPSSEPGNSRPSRWRWGAWSGQQTTPSCG